MNTEISIIRNEIANLSVAKLDLGFLEALANNALYCLNKHQTATTTSLPRTQKRLVDDVMTDLLQILHKEVVWAKEELEQEHHAAALDYYQKAKSQIIASLDLLL